MELTERIERRISMQVSGASAANSEYTDKKYQTFREMRTNLFAPDPTTDPYKKNTRTEKKDCSMVQCERMQGGVQLRDSRTVIDVIN